MRVFVTLGVLAAVALALFVSPRASSEPDGLERVARDHGFAQAERPHALEDGPVADYTVEGIDTESWSTALAGVIGVLVTLVVSSALFTALRARRAAKSERDGGAT